MVQRQVCPACAEVSTSGATWCEACGADFAGDHAAIEGHPCIDCQAAYAEIVDDYCGRCGRKQPSPRDHMTESLPAIGAVTDRGQRHHRNEDAFAIGSHLGQHLVVVCDGVSTTDNPDVASLSAATAARDYLASTPEARPEDRLRRAVLAAQDAAAAVPQLRSGQGPASTTIVAALLTVRPQSCHVSFASVGDSRAYWIDELGQVAQLTNDHSWASEQKLLGERSIEDIAADPRAHSITRWLGADAKGAEPAVASAEFSRPGRLLLCSDGLWNYAPTVEALSATIARLDNSDPLVLAGELVKFANASGGHDNITVIIVDGRNSSSPS